jgi:hypothetical protein
MEPNYTNRGYLLPPGCKDLIDVLNLKAKLSLSPQMQDFFVEFLKQRKPKVIKFEDKPATSPAPPAPPPVLRQIVIPAETTVAQLAALLEQRVVQIVDDVMALGFFVGTEDALSFEIITSVARKHGFMAIRGAT